MKGIILCGGMGTRLLPLTKVTNKSYKTNYLNCLIPNIGFKIFIFRFSNRFLDFIVGIFSTPLHQSISCKNSFLPAHHTPSLSGFCRHVYTRESSYPALIHS